MPAEDEFERYVMQYKGRLSMTPGLTGLWQLSGRSSITDFDEVVKLNMEYIDNWNIGKDIRILLMTVKIVLTGRGMTVDNLSVETDEDGQVVDGVL